MVKKSNIKTRSLSKKSKSHRKTELLKRAQDNLRALLKKLKASNKQLLKINRRLQGLVIRDYHTGLFNRRYLKEAIEKELSYARRHEQSFSLVLMDIDYFKAINDAYGHQFGDLVLKNMARKIKGLMRAHDITVRFGGEEFIIIAPKTDRACGIALAKRLLDAINSHNFGTKARNIKLKVSMAVVSYPEDGIIVDGMDLVYLADQILYLVKEYGGNRIFSSRNIEKFAAEEEIRAGTDVKFLKNKIERLAKRANQCVAEAIFAFAKTIGLKDRYTAKHIEAIINYAEEIAKGMGLPKNKVELVRKAAILHDLGKVGIEEEILRKKARLNEEEYEAVKKHPKIGADIIKPIKFLQDIIPVITSHHERWDGKGYPGGLKGNEIPIEARIIAIIDVYLSLISNRFYRKAFTKEQAIDIIKNGAGNAYDPEVVDAFLKIITKNNHGR